MTSPIGIVSNSYGILKAIHVSTVVLSGTLFVLRGVWMLRESSIMDQRWTKVVPHVVDSVLLASAIALIVVIQQYPFVHNWLTAKIAAVVIYIGLGMIAIGHGKQKPVRLAAWLLALLTFAYIVVTTLRHQPWPV